MHQFLSDRCTYCYLGFGKHCIGVLNGNHINWFEHHTTDTAPGFTSRFTPQSSLLSRARWRWPEAQQLRLRRHWTRLQPPSPGWRTGRRWRSRRWSTGSLPPGTRSIAFHYCTSICTVGACEKMMTTWNLTYHQWSITLLVTDRTCCLLDKHLYNSHSHHNTDPDNAQVCLDVMECTTGDAGQYALIITNKKGESKAAFSLNVWPQKISSVDLFWGKKASFLNPRDGGDPPKGARSLKNWDFIPATAAPGSPLLFILTCYLCKLTFIIPLQLRQHKSLIS